ncbi:MAG: TRAM domain-containing protein [Nanoarchaeota archaeon]|nr:TRAM domain-containing protein [Nanoarchaeota archaeon]
MYANNFQRSAPVKEGDELDVRIEALGEKGDGIAKKNGFVLVIPGTQVNDEVKVRVTKVLKKVGFAEVISKSAKKADSASKEEEEDLPEEEVEEVEEDSENFGEEEEQ